jgi:hypothetical protein
MGDFLTKYVIIYALPLALLLAAGAPDLQVWPKLQFLGATKSGQPARALAWLTVYNLVVYILFYLAWGELPFLSALGWELLYGWFARKAGPYLGPN